MRGSPTPARIAPETSRDSTTPSARYVGTPPSRHERDQEKFTATMRGENETRRQILSGGQLVPCYSEVGGVGFMKHASSNRRALSVLRAGSYYC